MRSHSALASAIMANRAAFWSDSAIPNNETVADGEGAVLLSQGVVFFDAEGLWIDIRSCFLGKTFKGKGVKLIK